MADIDDLLDEVENKFLVAPAARAPKAAPAKAAPTPASTHARGELDDLLDDLRDDSPLAPAPKAIDPKLAAAPAAVAPKKAAPGAKKLKCAALNIGGPGVPDSELCSELCCFNCDWRVYRFPGYEWDPKTDYLFLRNNIPEFERLKPNLLAKPGSAAYACQCKWRNASKIEDVTHSSELNWTCGGHAIV